MRFLRGFFLSTKLLGSERRLVPLLLPLLLAIGMVLEFVDIESGRVIVSIPVGPNFGFAINYHHSVDHQPIYEFFRVGEDGSIYLEWTKFKSFGAGMGWWKGRGKLEDCGGWTCIKDINYRVGSFVMVVGAPGVDHTLTIRGREPFNFSKCCPHRKILVRVRHGEHQN